MSIDGSYLLYQCRRYTTYKISCIITVGYIWLDDSMVKRVYKWSPALTRSLGRPKDRWEDDVKSDVANLRITNWKDCIRNRSKWKEFVEKDKSSPKL